MRLLALALLTLLASCSIFMRSMEKPKAEVRGVSMSAVSWSGVEGELRLDVTNPNSFGVPLSGIDWQLSIGGARAVSGKIELSQTIPARGVAPVATSLRIDARDAIAVGAALSRGQRGYALTARLHFSTPVGQVSVDLQHRGQISSPIGSSNASSITRSVLGLH
jgi:LEA14-like dessication related protein